MPPLPMNERTSSWGNIPATSATVGGWKGADPGGAAVSDAAPCLSRQAGQSPFNAPMGNAAPHWGHFFASGMVWSDSCPFIHPPQKQIREDVTGIIAIGAPL